MNWLRQQGEVVSGAASTGHQIAGRGLTGKQQDFAVWENPLDGDREFNARHPGENYVGNQQFGRIHQRRLQRLVPVVSGRGGISAAAKDLGYRICNCRFVVDHKHYRPMFTDIVRRYFSEGNDWGRTFSAH